MIFLKRMRAVYKLYRAQLTILRILASSSPATPSSALAYNTLIGMGYRRDVLDRVRGLAAIREKLGGPWKREGSMEARGGKNE